MKIVIIILIIAILTIVSCIMYDDFNIEGTYALTEPFAGRDRLDLTNGRYTFRKYLYSNLFEIAQVGTFTLTRKDDHFEIISDFEYLNGNFIIDNNNTLVNLDNSFRFYKQ